MDSIYFQLMKIKKQPNLKVRRSHPILKHLRKQKAPTKLIIKQTMLLNIPKLPLELSTKEKLAWKKKIKRKQAAVKRKIEF